MPWWVDNENISFIRTALDEENTLILSLVNMNLISGEQKTAANLSDDGIFIVIFDV